MRNDDQTPGTDGQNLLARAGLLLDGGRPLDALALLSPQKLAELTPDQRVEGLVLRGRTLMQTADPRTAGEPLEQALALAPDHEEACFLLAMVHFDLEYYFNIPALLTPELARRHGPLGMVVRAMALRSSGNATAEALNLCEEVIAAEPAWTSVRLMQALLRDRLDHNSLDAQIDEYRRSLTLPEGLHDPLHMHVGHLKDDVRTNLRFRLWAQGRAACPEDFADPAPQDPPWLLVAAQMKSGSSFVTTVLGHLTGSPWFNFAPFPTGRGGTLNIDLHTLLQNRTRRLILHQHTLGTIMTVQMVQAFSIPTVVMIRDLADALLSLAEYIENGYGALEMFGDMAAWPRARRLDAVIDRFGPWMIEHYVSWALAARENRVAPLFLTYDTLVADKTGAIHQIIRHFGLEASEDKIAAVVAQVDQDRAGTRFNKGQTGRGCTALSSPQRARLERMISHYPPDLDYSPLGF